MISSILKIMLLTISEERKKKKKGFSYHTLSSSSSRKNKYAVITYVKGGQQITNLNAIFSFGNGFSIIPSIKYCLTYMDCF